MNTKGVIFDIKKYALHDGPGIRTTIFFKGCPLSCWWCHNPEGQKLEIETFNIPVSEPDSAPTSRKEIVGREVSVTEVIAEIEKDWLFYDESSGGVTFSGGEPLMQPKFLEQLLDACIEREISTTLDTCGYVSWKILDSIKDKVDLFLYDVKIVNDSEHQKYTGVSNKWILSNLKKLDEEEKVIILRFPVIPTITDTEENIHQMMRLMSTLRNVNEINLLPYHKIGDRKYEKLSRTNQLVDLKPPSTQSIKIIGEKFRDIGFKVKIGG